MVTLPIFHFCKIVLRKLISNIIVSIKNLKISKEKRKINSVKMDQIERMELTEPVNNETNNDVICRILNYIQQFSHLYVHPREVE
jgi:hypothetical protein